jgi:hypothetical protein
MPFVRILLVIALAWSWDEGITQIIDLVPKPELSPEQVVQYQVTALQQNDDQKSDAGIERAFRFASPSNRRATGPLEHFAQVLKGPVYAPMLNNRSSSIVGSEVKDNQATVVVKIVAINGANVTYVFALTKQSEGDYKNCWMTDGVAPLKVEEGSPDQGVTI